MLKAIYDSMRRSLGAIGVLAVVSGFLLYAGSVGRPPHTPGAHPAAAQPPSAHDRRPGDPPAEPRFYRINAAGPLIEELGNLARQANLIVVGEVTGVLGEDYCTRGFPDLTIPPQRTYQVNVTQVLLASETVTEPGLIKVTQHSGATLEGVTHRVAGEPFLNVGDRYILFLRDYHPNLAGTAGVMTEDGLCFPLDEYSLQVPAMSVVRLVNGEAVPNADEFQEAEPMEFYSGPQIHGVTEAQAIANILSVL
jgi:hypothetical protein